MFATIIPRTLLPLNTPSQEFLYKIPEKLENDIKIGQIVEIPFKNKNIQGVIMNIKPTSNIQNKFIKEIKKIISKNFLLSKTQLDIINFLHEKYHINKSLAFKTVVPLIPKKEIKKK